VSDPVAEILMFQVGPCVFAAKVRDAIRIGAVRDVPAGELVLDSALGKPFTYLRGIVVAAGAGERTLVVDQVLGVRSVPEEDLLPLPAFAAACITSGAVSGLVLLDDAPTPLVDLLTLVRDSAPPVVADPNPFTLTEAPDA
jgi:hypothetical protein